MLNFTSKTESKLLQTIPHKGVDLCSSLSTLMWGFVFTIQYKLSQTRPRIEATLRDSLVAKMRGLVLLLTQTITMKKTATFFVLLFLLVPSLSFASFDVSVKYGSKGPAVSEVQDFLTDQGFLKGTVDGKFGFATLRAVKAFQTANNLTPDGYFGKASRSAAQSILADLTQGSDAEETADTGTVSAPVVQPAPPKPVSDTGTQTQISALTQQVAQQQTTLNQIAQNTQTIANNSTPAYTSPMPPVSDPVITPVQTPLVEPALVVTNDSPNGYVSQTISKNTTHALLATLNIQNPTEDTGSIFLVNFSTGVFNANNITDNPLLTNISLEYTIDGVTQTIPTTAEISEGPAFILADQLNIPLLAGDTIKFNLYADVGDPEGNRTAEFIVKPSDFMIRNTNNNNKNFAISLPYNLDIVNNFTN